MSTTVPTRCDCEKPSLRFAGRADGVELETCHRPNLLVCVACSGSVVARCGRSSRAVCSPCSETYRRRVAQVARSGFIVTGRDEVWVLTLTAPGDRQHRLPGGDLCPCTPAGGVDVARWNGTLGRRWSDFITSLRYRFGDVQYFSAKEVQQRGALHQHVPLVFEPGTRVSVSWLRSLAIHHGFGHSLTLDRIDLRSRQAERAAWYVAKYVSKSATDRATVPFVDRRTGEVGPGRWRTWSSSRRWGTSMAAVRSQQRAWASERAPAARGTDGACDAGPPAPEAPLDLNTRCSGNEPPAALVASPM